MVQRCVRDAVYGLRGGALWVAYLLVTDRSAIDRDLRRLRQPRLDLDLPEKISNRDRLQAFSRPEFRSLLYERLRLRVAGGPAAALGVVLQRFLRAQVALYFSCDDIGPGLYVAHGFATVVVAERIGMDCLISQQVTIGYSDKGGPPVLGDRVRIGAGAIVLGPITVGDDAVDRFSALRRPSGA